MTAASEETDRGPLGGLSLYESPIFKETYIDLVALELRWNTPTRAVSEMDLLILREAIEAKVIGLRLPYLDRIEQRAVTIVLDVEGDQQPSPASEHGFQLRDGEQSVAIAVLPQSIAIQLSAYEKWSISALPVLEAVLTWSRTLEPGLVARVGLRYINRLQDPACRKPEDWAGKIAPALLAPYREWGLREWVRQASQQIELVIDADHGAQLRHGVLLHSGGAAGDYLIDVDVFSQRIRETEPEALTESFTRMNRTALAIFQQSVNHDYLLQRQPEEEEKEEEETP